MTQLENFEQAFSGGTGSIRRTCHCGKEYYNYMDAIFFDEGELEALQADEKAIGVDYTIGTVIFGGREYANACLCWHDHAEKVIEGLYDNGQGIEKFFKLEKERLKHELDSLPQPQAL